MMALCPNRMVSSPIVALLLSLCAVPCFAQATRTWVSGVGDDANPCSRTAPCKTFAGAISKTAVGGEIDAMDPGGFGALTITHSITIDGGEGTIGSILVAGTNALVIAASPSDEIIIRNLSLQGANQDSMTTPGINGISITSAGAVHIEHVTIQNFGNRGISSVSSSWLYVNDVTVKNNVNGGILVQNGRANLDNVRATDNNAFGILATSGGIVAVTNSAVGGGVVGICSNDVSGVVTIESTMVANAQYGVGALHGGTVRLSNTSVFSNSAGGLLNDGSSFIVSFGNNRIVGNGVDGNFTSTIALR
jgi:hypothetical protein